MGIFGSVPVNQAASDSLDDRYNVAQVTHAAAISVFADIADQLDEAAELYDSVAREAHEEITRLTLVRDEAITASANARKSTEHVLNLTRGIPT